MILFFYQRRASIYLPTIFIFLQPLISFLSSHPHYPLCSIHSITLKSHNPTPQQIFHMLRHTILQVDEVMGVFLNLYQYHMNNFLNMARKVNRNSLERRVISQLNAKYPGLEQSISTHRFPVLPKIVLYTSLAGTENILSRLLPFYQVITPTPTAETDQIITRRIAEQLTRVGGEESSNASSGFILRGFPFNTNQALLLDRYLNGVNLAIFLKVGNESGDYTNSIQPLLNYYNERGSLLEINHNANPTSEDILNVIDDIRINIKRSS